MSTLFLILVLIILALVIVFALDRDAFWARLAGPADLGRYDFQSGARTGKPNDALACTQGLCGGKADINLDERDATPEALIAEISARIEKAGRPARRVDDGADKAYARYVVVSPLMHFPDTVDIEAVRLDNGHTGLRAYARAKLGHSDMGANRAFLKKILE